MTQQTLTASKLARLVNLTNASQSSRDRVKLDLSDETAKLAILDLFNNQIEKKFPVPLTAETIVIIAVEVEPDGFISITWRRKGTRLGIGNRFSIAEYNQITQASDRIATYALKRRTKNSRNATTKQWQLVLQHC
ncbi:MAG: hypothetical protein QNJ38_18805 [Prochloraceae cyanobacterium]|nr:hypothetical protein [Prochloraceae cyanobacterium]